LRDREQKKQSVTVDSKEVKNDSSEQQKANIYRRKEISIRTDEENLRDTEDGEE